MRSGAEQLKDWMHRRRFMQKEAAEYLNFHETYISQIMNGFRSPGLDNAIVIERMTGIPVEAWSSQPDTQADNAAVSASERHNAK